MKQDQALRAARGAALDTQLTVARNEAKNGMDWVHLWMVLRLLAAIAASFWLASLIPWIAPRFIAYVLLAGFFQRWFTSTPFHESMHGTLFSNKIANRLGGELSTALALVDYEQARRGHLLHHKYLASSRDPEVQEMKAYGLKPTGMTRNELKRMLRMPLHPKLVGRNMLGVGRLLVARPAVLCLWVMTAMTLGLVLGASMAAEILAAWLFASFTVRSFLYLLANSSEHDFPMAHALESGQTEVARELSIAPKPIQWLAISRERRGWVFFLCCPESERRWHGDHHADAPIPGSSLRQYVRTKLALDERYAKKRNIVYGLFPSGDGREAAYSSLLRGVPRHERS